MCRFAVNLSISVHIKHSTDLVASEQSLARYLAACLYWAGYDVWMEGALVEVCCIGDKMFNLDDRYSEVMFGTGSIRVSKKEPLQFVTHLSCCTLPQAATQALRTPYPSMACPSHCAQKHMTGCRTYLSRCMCAFR